MKKIVTVLLFFCFFACHAMAQAANDITTKPEDLDSSWNAATAVKISLNRTSISVEGSGGSSAGSSGAAVRGTTVTISRAGTYLVSGTLLDGQVLIEATNKDLVHLVLNNADITNTRGAPIYASQCDKLVVTLAPGSRNTLTDGGSRFVYVSTADEEPNAALFCKDDLSINGTGALLVNAGFNNGIGTKDDLLIAGGVITVKAANHGLRGNDSLSILGGTFVVDSTGDAIHSQGTVAISGGDFALTSRDDGIHADQELRISGGNIRVLASYEGLEAAHIYISAGTISVVAQDDGINGAGGDNGSTAGFDRNRFNAGDYSINISGGNVTVRAGSDGLDSNGSITISGGTLVSLTSARSNMGTGALDANGQVTFTGGTIIYGGTSPGNTPGAASTQSYVYVTTPIPANSTISVRKDGATLISFTPPVECSNLVLSSPAITAGQSYEIYQGAGRIATATAGSGGGGGFGGGWGGGMGGRGGRMPGRR